MPRDNIDKVSFDDIKIDRTDWRDPGGPNRKFSPTWRAKDKMRAVVVVDGDTLALDYENVSGWTGEAFANVWCATIDDQGAWRMGFVSTLERSRERRVGTDPSGAAIMRQPLDMRAPGLPEVGESAVWVIGSVDQSVRAANRLYVTPDYIKEPPVEEPESLLPIVKEERAKYGTPLENLQMGELMNSVALRGGSGWGLALKETGNHTVQPVTGTRVSRDVLIHAPSDLMYDVLVDVAGAGTPAWNLIGPADMEWVAPVATEVDPDVKGNPWPCFEDGRAPVLVMTPEGPQSDATWSEWMLNAYPEHVAMLADGTHTPLDGVVTSQFRQLYRKNSEAELVTMCWCVFENEGDADDALEVVRQLVVMYDQVTDPGWLIVGPVWDVFQAGGFDDVNGWIADAEAIAGDRGILIGARARRGLDQYNGSFASFETHVDDTERAFSIFGQSVLMSGNRMVGEFDRFRVRPGSGRPKDLTEEDVPIICEASRARRVAIILGHENETGARPFALRASIREILDTDDAPPPPPVERPPLELAGGWGCVAWLSAPWKALELRTHCKNMDFVRLPMGLATMKGNAEEAGRWAELSKQSGLRVAVSVFDGASDLMPNEGAVQDWILDVAGRIEHALFILDVEADNPKFMPGGWPQYVRIFGPMIEPLKQMGHYVAGPGPVHSDVAGLVAALSEIPEPFDLVSIHAYPDQGWQKMWDWVDEARRVALDFGYERGILGEIGATGDPETFSQRYCPYDSFREHRDRVARLTHDYWERRDFWREAFYYQALDEPNRSVAGFGLFTHVVDPNDEHGERWEPKPAAAIFNE